MKGYYERLAELSGLIAHWERREEDARSARKQAEMDEHTAQKNRDAFKRQLDELMATKEDE